MYCTVERMDCPLRETLTGIGLDFLDLLYEVLVYCRTDGLPIVKDSYRNRTGLPGPAV